jgi:PAS domain S-box-containing protein
VAVSTTEGKVLIVEDEVMYALDVQRFLANRHIDASVCHTGEEALRVMSQDPDIALVLMDLDLGEGVGGIETARRILKHHDVPLLFLSVHTEWELADPLLGIDHYGFLPKSAGEFAILQGVNAALKLARSRRELLASEERYRGLIESLSDSVLVIDGDYTVQSANGAAVSLLGGVQGAVGAKCYRCYHGFESPCPWCPAVEVLASGARARRVVPFSAGGGESKWFNLEASAVRDPDDAVVGVVLSGRDVSQEEDTRKRYEELFRFAPQPYQSLAPSGRFIDVNEEWCAVLGYSRDQVVGRHFSEFLAQEAVALFSTRFPAFLQAGRVDGVEFPVVKSNGEILLCRFYGRVAYDAHRVPLRTHCIFQDLTPQRRAEEKFQRLFHSAPLGVFRSTADGRFLEANPAFVELLGYSSGEEIASKVKELGWTLFLDAEEAATIAGVLKRGMGIGPSDLRVRRKDGSHRVVRLHINRVQDAPGAHDVLEGFCEDITERQAMQKEVEERELLLRTFVNQSLDAIVITDTKGKITSWNPAAEKQFRSAAGEALGTPVWDTVLLNAVAPEEDESRIRTLRDHMKLLLATGDAPVAGSIVETEYEYPDATRRTAHQRFFAIEGSHGYQLGLVSRDVTDLVIAERALADRHRRVTDLLEERELLLKEVHHRIKNDMLLVRSLLSLQAGRTSSEETAAELSDAANRITLMSRIYERLYRSDNYESIQIRQTVLSIVSDLLSGAGRGQLSLETDIEERELPRKIAVPIGIIINELVSNALKYAFDGTGDPRLRVALGVNDGMVELEVEDNGPGMPAALRRDDGTLQPETIDGFGYTMIGALVAQHTGTLSVADAETGGTVVRVTLALPE